MAAAGTGDGALTPLPSRMAMLGHKRSSKRGLECLHACYLTLLQLPPRSGFLCFLLAICVLPPRLGLLAKYLADALCYDDAGAAALIGHRSVLGGCLFFECSKAQCGPWRLEPKLRPNSTGVLAQSPSRGPVLQLRSSCTGSKLMLVLKHTSCCIKVPVTAVLANEEDTQVSVPQAT